MATQADRDRHVQLEQGRFAAVVLLKLSRAIPLHISDPEALEKLTDFNSLMLRMASLLPSHEAEGFGSAQQQVILSALSVMRAVARDCVLNPLSKMSISMVDLLRELARGTEVFEKDRAFVPTNALQPSQYRVHGYASNTPVHFADGLAKTELLYETLLEGLRRWTKLDAEWVNSIDTAVWQITPSLLMWGPALLFDGLRLRAGLKVAAPCGVMAPGQRQPFGLDTIAAQVLSDGETRGDRERVGRTAQFVLAAAWAGWDAYGGGEEERRCREQPWRKANEIAELLKECRREHECRSPMPGKSMRIILNAFVDVAYSAPYYEEDMKLLQMAFAFPCLYTHNLASLDGYDGGLLSIWDACNHLLLLYAQEHSGVPSVQDLLCAVLGGVVLSLLSDAPVGPFYVAQRDVLSYMARIGKQWPGSCLDAEHEAPSPPPRYRASSRTEHRGKCVSATSALLDALARDAYKPAPRLTDVVEARFDAALTMRSVSENLARHCGQRHSLCHPTDGIVAIKHLYFAALHAEPWMPDKAMRDSSGHLSDASPLVEVPPRGIPGCIPNSAVETPWREVNGGACLVSGALFAFSRQGFKESLEEDWRPRPEVQSALEAREGNASERAKSVMLSSSAMVLMTERAKKHVAQTVTEIDNAIKSQQGPPYVARIAELLNVLSNKTYGASEFNPLWESSIIHFCSVVQSTKRRRDDCASPVSSDTTATINGGSGLEI